MSGYPPDRIRNVALVGHGGSGKTTLAEALLHHAGAITRMGRVEDGTTVTDFEPEEVKRRLSLSLALATFEYAPPGASGVAGCKVNLLDTPGYADFVGDVHAALRVADLAVFVVSAVEGVEVQTEAAWRLAAALGVPRMIFVNKLDRERASFDRTLDQLRTVFGAGVAPLELPIGEESAFCGIADLLTDTAYVYEGGVARADSIPDEMEAAEQEVHEALVEGIVVADDDLLERYLEGDVPSFEALERCLAHGVAEATVFPVVCGSALLEIGIDRLATFLCEIGSSPADRPPVEVRAGDTTVGVAADPDGETLAFVFDTIADPYVGHVSLFKVLSGRLRADAHLVNSRTGTDERLHTLFSLRGKEHVEVTEVVAGDIAAVAKLATTRTGDTLAPRSMPVVVPPIDVPEPALSIAIRPRSQADEDKLATALHRLQEEDPVLRADRDDETHQTLLRAMGETHLAVSLERMHRKFGVDVDTEDIRVAYRETVSEPAEAEGRYKKQSGGHGQFGIAHIRVEPLDRGAGFEFIDAIVGGAIPRQFIPAVEKGVREAMASGGSQGYPVVDIRVICDDGKYHSVDSSEMSFKMAGSLGFREAVAKASPVVLEPISLLEVWVPETQQGDVMGDLNARRGRVQGTEPDGEHTQRITAMVPTSELLRYAIDLRSLTGGRGRFSAHHDHYDPVPAHLVERLVSAAGP
ncbi:MAG: elongation factor G [Acidimicrobiia bacterium]|nr:elongation factor G [Acidimicrobiia bacterium]